MMRLWLVETKKMVGPEYGPGWHRYVIKLDGSVIGPSGKLVHAIIMRKTDMRDKSGKSIYYGDIVRLNDGTIIDVRYIGMSSVLAPALVRGDCEVIGNIFETPRMVSYAVIPGVLRGTQHGS